MHCIAKLDCALTRLPRLSSAEMDAQRILLRSLFEVVENMLTEGRDANFKICLHRGSVSMVLVPPKSPLHREQMCTFGIFVLIYLFIKFS